MKEEKISAVCGGTLIDLSTMDGTRDCFWHRCLRCGLASNEPGTCQREVVACGECLHSSGQLDGQTCRRCAGTGLVPA